MLLAAGALTFLELRATITVEIDGQKQTATIWGWTVEDALASAGISVTEGDVVTPELESRL
ncbi:MAG TPA: hypothetical protein DEH22_06000, partial [Chloroflexi bacterium]|nr:hypothetical protein [Chloroflexota bacterium]